MGVSNHCLSYLVLKDPIDRIKHGVKWDRVIRDPNFHRHYVELFPHDDLGRSLINKGTSQAYAAADLKSVSCRGQVCIIICPSSHGFVFVRCCCGWMVGSFLRSIPMIPGFWTSVGYLGLSANEIALGNSLQKILSSHAAIGFPLIPYQLRSPLVPQVPVIDQSHSWFWGYGLPVHAGDNIREKSETSTANRHASSQEDARL